MFNVCISEVNNVCFFNIGSYWLGLDSRMFRILLMINIDSFRIYKYRMVIMIRDIINIIY